MVLRALIRARFGLKAKVRPELSVSPWDGGHAVRQAFIGCAGCPCLCLWSVFFHPSTRHFF